jgi:multicomponent Na+:H+ antiporter subunit E
MSRLVRIALLVGIWLALWSDLSAANVVSGVVVALAIVLVFDAGQAGHVVVRPIHAARFLAFFVFKLVMASFVVARTVIAPRDRIHTGIVAVPLGGCSDALATLVADAISLTPGTLTLEVRPDPLTLYVHTLDVRTVEQVRRDVRTLEVLAVRAFGDRTAIAGLESDDSRSWTGR